jgi:pimeloyl-ACP methyl ester carboxylesterase
MTPSSDAAHVRDDPDRGRSRPTFVLLHGAGSDPWYWHLVAPDLAAAGSEVVTVDLPVDDDACGLAEYARAAVDAIGPRRNLTLVAQSMAAFTAPMVATELAVDQIVLVAPMVPAPGETPGRWWDNTGQPEAARQDAIRSGRRPDRPFDPIETFLHDVDPAIVAASASHVRTQSDRPFGDLWPLDQWPDIPTSCVIGRHDRFFPRRFQRRVIQERLGLLPDEIDSGHLPALSRPEALTRLLIGYRFVFAEPAGAAGPRQ